MFEFSYMRPKSALLLAIVCGLIAACSPIRDNEARKAEAGESCGSDLDCGAALVCTNGRICSIVGDPGTAERGEVCTSDDSCRLGLNCNARGLCDRTVPRALDERCTSQAGCEVGLVCSHSGRCLDPDDPESEGISALDEACSAPQECALGLTCGPEGRCIEFLPWSGVECAQVDPTETPQVIFKIPRAPGDGDFFSLPYPNNIRRAGTGLDLSNYPGTAPTELPSDLLAPYAFLNEGPTRGFGTNPSVIFRFNTPVDYNSLRFGGEDANFLFVDITPDSPGYGLAPRSRYYATGAGSPFICPNWLGIRPSEGSPLAPGRTYAVLFLESIVNTDGVPLEASEDFLSLLGETSPAEAALIRPWRTFRPLRQYLIEQELTDQVIGGTIFTTGVPQEYLSGVRTAVQAAPPPTIVSNTVCGSGPPSPCALEGDRQCGGADPDNEFIEVHAIARLPRYLDGEPPYEDGGGNAHIDYRTGRPYLQGVEDVCLSISIPTGTPPEGGWPTAIFAHDLGGHFRTAVRRGIAKNLAGSERGARWATVGFDGVLHGTRSGIEQDPSMEVLADQLLNPSKTGLFLDHALQGVSDLHAIVRLLSGGAVAGLGSPNSRLSAERIAVIGHGMGADIAVPSLSLSRWLRRRSWLRHLAIWLINFVIEKHLSISEPRWSWHSEMRT